MMLLPLAATPVYLYAADAPAPDTLVLSNGDTLHGKLVEEAGGTVTFHCDPLGDVKLTVGQNQGAARRGEFRRAERADERIGVRRRLRSYRKAASTWPTAR